MTEREHKWFLNTLKRKNALYCRIDVWGFASVMIALLFLFMPNPVSYHQSRGSVDLSPPAYPVVSGNHYMLGLTLERRFREVSGATYVVVRGRCARGSKTEERLEGGHGLPSAIVPKNELVQVDLQLRAANPMVSTEKPLLEVPDGTVASVIHHRSSELVKHHPGGLVTPKPKLALNK